MARTQNVEAQTRWIMKKWNLFCMLVRALLFVAALTAPARRLCVFKPCTKHIPTPSHLTVRLASSSPTTLNLAYLTLPHLTWLDFNLSTHRRPTSSHVPHMSAARANHWNIVLSPTYTSASRTNTSSTSSSARKSNKKPVSKPFKCPICSRCFERTGHLQTHITAVHEQKQPYKCDYPGCLQSFGHRSSLSRHRKGIHKII